MHNANIPEYTELPSNKRLVRSTIVAIVSAAAILVAIVLPAEYGIDPTGIGSVTGLKRMGEIKTALAEELEASRMEAGDSSGEGGVPELDGDSSSDAGRSDTMSVTLGAGESTEIKLTMRKDGRVEFNWSTDVGEAFYDLHGDSKEVNYHVYEKGTASSKEGTLVAEFDGNHGWYWKNRSSAPMTISLTTSGRYQAIKEMK